MPAIVLQVECLGAHVAIVHATVQEETGVLVHHPVYVSIQTSHVVLGGIVVSSVQQVVAVIERVRLDSIVGKAVAQVDAQHHLCCKGVEGQSDVVRLLRVQIGVTIGEHGGVGAVYIRIQIGNTGTRDSHVVRQAEVGSGSDAVGQAG